MVEKLGSLNRHSLQVEYHDYLDYLPCCQSILLDNLGYHVDSLNYDYSHGRRFDSDEESYFYPLSYFSVVDYLLCNVDRI